MARRQGPFCPEWRRKKFHDFAFQGLGFQTRGSQELDLPVWGLGDPGEGGRR